MGKKIRPRGASEGPNGAASHQYIVSIGEPDREAVTIGGESLSVGQYLVHELSGGGGYGSPLHREAERVRTDVLVGLVSLEAARELYGVLFTGELATGTLKVDQTATNELRSGLLTKA